MPVALKNHALNVYHFIPPSSIVFMAESLVILSFPFHKKLKIIWLICFIMFDGVGSYEDT